MSNKHIVRAIQAIVLLGIFLMLTAQGNNTGEKYFLAFAQENTSEVRVRYSKDGANWDDGNLPAQAVSLPIKGVAGMVDQSGLMHVLVTDQQDAINFVWGIGPAIWDSSDRPVPSNPVQSAPAGVHLGDARWFAAYKTSGDRITASVYDTGERRFVTEPVGLSSALNNNVDGRPAVAYMNGKILLMWRRYADSAFSLIRTIGTLDSGIPTFTQAQEVSLPLDADYKAGIHTDPDVTHANGLFYALVTRQAKGSSECHVYIYTSPDGMVWTRRDRVAALSVVASSEGTSRKSYVNIAARSDGKLLAAAIDGSGSAGRITAAKNDGQNWTSLSSGEIVNMFGANRAYPRQFWLMGCKDFQASTGGGSCN